MEAKKRAELVGLFVLLVSSGAVASWYYQSSVNYTDLTFYAWITNPTNESITQTSLSISVYPNLPMNLSGSEPKAVNSTFDVWPSGTYITATISALNPGQTIVIEDQGIPIHAPLESQQFNQSVPVYVTGYNSKLNVAYMSRIFAQSAFGRISAESVYTFQKGGIQETDERVFTTEYSLVLFESLALLGFGCILFARRWRIRGFPFITLAFASVSSLAYTLVGSGWEVDKLSDLAILRNPLTSLFFHGYFQHITGNLPYFIVASVVLEYWISGKTGRRRYIWYAAPIVGALGVATRGFIADEYSFGLSILIEFLSFSLWTFVLANWRKLAAVRLNMLLILLSGLTMGAWYGWVYDLLLEVPFNAFNTPFDLMEADGHVIAGVVGLAALIIYLGSAFIDRQARALLSHLRRRRKTK